MHIVLVHIHIKSEFTDAFIQATRENAKNSRLEPGIARFDFIQQVDHPDQFILVEVYHRPEDQLEHRDTPHYKLWKETVTEMMAETRVGIIYRNIDPGEDGWGK